MKQQNQIHKFQWLKPRWMVTLLLLSIIILSTTSCGGSKNDITGKWKVASLYVSTKEGGYSEEAKRIYGFIWGIREFNFKKDGTFEIFDTMEKKTYSGKWNDGKDDKDPIFQFLGKGKFTIVLRWNDGTYNQQHMWTTYASYEKSIITEKDKIHTEITPAIQEGNIGLYLERVK